MEFQPDSYRKCLVPIHLSPEAWNHVALFLHFQGWMKKDATRTFREISTKSLKLYFEHEEHSHFLRTDIHLILTSFEFTWKLNLQVEPFEAWNRSRSWEHPWDCRQCCWPKADPSFELKSPGLNRGIPFILITITNHSLRYKTSRIWEGWNAGVMNCCSTARDNSNFCSSCIFQWLAFGIGSSWLI